MTADEIRDLAKQAVGEYVEGKQINPLAAQIKLNIMQTFLMAEIAAHLAELVSVYRDGTDDGDPSQDFKIPATAEPQA